jgi:hypothetical protein
MTLAGPILALDLANKTGFAIGEPFSVPRSGMVTLKRSDEARARAMGNLIAWLQEQWKGAKPALVVREAPFPLEAFRKRHNSQAAAELAYGLHGVLEGMCDRFNVRLESVHPATARKHFIGRANAGERSTTKATVVARCHVLRLMPKDCFDDNRADALAVWDWACATFGQRSGQVSALYLFGERPR